MCTSLWLKLVQTTIALLSSVNVLALWIIIWVLREGPSLDHSDDQCKREGSAVLSVVPQSFCRSSPLVFSRSSPEQWIKAWVAHMAISTTVLAFRVVTRSCSSHCCHWRLRHHQNCHQRTQRHPQRRHPQRHPQRHKITTMMTYSSQNRQPMKTRSRQDCCGWRRTRRQQLQNWRHHKHLPVQKIHGPSLSASTIVITSYGSSARLGRETRCECCRLYIHGLPMFSRCSPEVLTMPIYVMVSGWANFIEGVKHDAANVCYGRWMGEFHWGVKHDANVCYGRWMIELQCAESCQHVAVQQWTGQMRNSRRPARDAERRESEIQSTGCDHDPKLLRVRKQKRPPLGAIDYCRKLLYIDRFSSIRWSLLRAIISAMRLQCNVVFCFICTPSVLLSISLIKSVFEKLAFWFYMTLTSRNKEFSATSKIQEHEHTKSS